MCGINGAWAWHPNAAPPEEARTLRAREAQRRRGPDGAGLWVSNDHRVHLAHRRLSIIDLSERAAQPMQSGDGRLVITFNGEIYNYRELKGELIGSGARFRTSSDTEVLLEGYRAWGPAVIERLRGMFAFAIWDENERSLFLARDPYGIKPLYYADLDGTFCFASQVRAIDHYLPSTRLDPAGLVGFLLWGSVPEPHTIRDGVRALAAGHWLRVTGHGVEAPRQYWSVEQTVRTSLEEARRLDEARARERAIEALRDTVRAHLVADVQVGAFLSAGLDSGSLTGLAHEVAGKPLTAITMTFEELANGPHDEGPVAHTVARHLGLRHHIHHLSFGDVKALYPRFLSDMDQPTVDGFNTWLVSRAAAELGLNVALSGLGGDELLGGYWTFDDVPARTNGTYHQAVSTPTLLGRLRGAVAATPAAQPVTLTEAYRAERRLFLPSELRAIVRRDTLEEGLGALADGYAALDSGLSDLPDFAKVMVLESTRYMRNQLLRDTDWASMAHSLEVRVPLVDARLAEQVAGPAALGLLPARKAILPGALATPLPKAALERPKTGFTVPVWRWVNNMPELSAWRRNRALRRKGVRAPQRLAYCLLESLPGASEHLR